MHSAWTPFEQSVSSVFLRCIVSGKIIYVYNDFLHSSVVDEETLSCYLYFASEAAELALFWFINITRDYFLRG